MEKYKSSILITKDKFNTIEVSKSPYGSKYSDDLKRIEEENTTRQNNIIARLNYNKFIVTELVIIQYRE